MLSLRVLDAAVNEIVYKCRGGEDCMKEAVGARCGEAWVSKRCDENCLRSSLRRCQGDGTVEGLVRRFAEMLLWIGCMGVLVAFGGGIMLALAACADQLLAEIARILKIKETFSLCLSWALKTRDQIHEYPSEQLNGEPP